MDKYIMKLEFRLGLKYITAYKKSLVFNDWKEDWWMFVTDYGKRGQMKLYLDSIFYKREFQVLKNKDSKQ
jgi:hypothetical protein